MVDRRKKFDYMSNYSEEDFTNLYDSVSSDSEDEWTSETLKYRGSLKSSMGSTTQIYSSTQGEHKNIN
jgi:hypothetical protein